jgi:hypothetical protein
MQVQPYQPYQPLEVEAMWFQDLVFILLAVGMVAYFIKVGPAKFFERVWE